LWESFRIRFIAGRLKRADFLPFQRHMNNGRANSIGPGHPDPGFKTLSRGVRARPDKRIPGSARYEHDKKRKKTGG
jgi:hypothetical protein